jgi:hypothetical protein
VNRKFSQHWISTLNSRSCAALTPIAQRIHRRDGIERAIRTSGKNRVNGSVG